MPVLSVPRGPLAQSIARLGAQAGVSIGLIDPVLARTHVPAIHGRITVGVAFDRLLKGLPARARRIDALSWRIERVSPAKVASPRPRPIPVRPPVAPPIDTGTIVVTASKRGTRLSQYPGTVAILDGAVLGRGGGPGSDALVARLPVLSQTALGPGRNKLFIRGIADSSFNGPSQATTGEYLGDVRLNYSAPDPDLRLIDIDRVEVLEGPQGTLYGAATLGGVVRIVPNAPALDRTQVIVNAGIAATAGGAGSGDGSVTLDLPIVRVAAGLRAVLYRAVDGGYIDDRARDLQDVNRTITRGGRATLRAKPGGWTIDLGVAYQAINSDDAQYATRDIGARARASRIAQPFDNDYALGSLSATRDIAGMTLRMAGGLVAQNLNARYDFTPAGAFAPVLFAQDNRIRLLSGETSLARQGRDGAGWIAGLSAFQNDERLTRGLGPVESPMRILGVRNEVANISAFFEWSRPIGERLLATVGARLDAAHLVGRPLNGGEGQGDEVRRNERKLLPTLALRWRTVGGDTLFLRYQEGFRAGGLSVSGSGTAAVQRFGGDGLKMLEAGGRFANLLGSGFDGAATLSYSHWEDIQADLVDAGGQPFTANIGTGRVIAAELRVDRRLGTGLRGEASLFLNRSRLTRPAAFLGAGEDPALPNIARAGGRAALILDRPIGGGKTLSGEAGVRYVGRSRLGIGPALGFRQGGYVDSRLSLRIGDTRRGFTIDVTNLANGRGNRFALGNPYDVAAGRQTVPLRPRTARIGFDARF